jgi:hypothetical protein
MPHFAFSLQPTASSCVSVLSLSLFQRNCTLHPAGVSRHRHVPIQRFTQCRMRVQRCMGGNLKPTSCSPPPASRFGPPSQRPVRARLSKRPLRLAIVPRLPWEPSQRPSHTRHRGTQCQALLLCRSQHPPGAWAPPLKDDGCHSTSCPACFLALSHLTRLISDWIAGPPGRGLLT